MPPLTIVLSWFYKHAVPIGTYASLDSPIQRFNVGNQRPQPGVRDYWGRSVRRHDGPERQSDRAHENQTTFAHLK